MFLVMYITLSLSMFVQVLNEPDNNNFGPYDMTWAKFQTCKGPKQGNCGDFKIENTQNMSNVMFVMNFPKDCPVTKAKITIGNKQSNSSTVKKMWNYALDSPCQHFVLGPILVDSFNLTSSCKINKGPYEVHLDMNSKCRLFLGKSFFYGYYHFKMIAHNKNKNFFCVNSEIIVEPKKY